jgi:hypothetical protein
MMYRCRRPPPSPRRCTAQCGHRTVTDSRRTPPIDVPTTPATKKAIVLFDGKTLDNWLSRNGKVAAPWKVLPGGILEVKSPTADIITKQKFDGKFKLHVDGFKMRSY